MPYISVKDYARIRHLIKPQVPQVSAEVKAMEQSIYALNRRIRNLPGDNPTPEWTELMEQHGRLLAAYRAGGGRRL